MCEEIHENAPNTLTGTGTVHAFPDNSNTVDYFIAKSGNNSN